MSGGMQPEEKGRAHRLPTAKCSMTRPIQNMNDALKPPKTAVTKRSRI